MSKGSSFFNPMVVKDFDLGYLVMVKFSLIFFEKWPIYEYSNIMIKKESEAPLEEFKFHYHLGNSVGSSDKYFMAHDLDEASEMFTYACSKRHLDPHLTKVEKWNRWKRDWENIEPLPSCPTLN